MDLLNVAKVLTKLTTATHPIQSFPPANLERLIGLATFVK